MNHEKADLRAVDLFYDGMKDPIDKALTGKLTRWELPFHLRHRIEQLTAIVRSRCWCKTNVIEPDPIRLIDTSESDIPDPFWYEWAFWLSDERTDGDEKGFSIDIREESPKYLAYHIRTYGQELIEMADKIESMDW